LCGAVKLRARNSSQPISLDMSLAGRGQSSRIIKSAASACRQTEKGTTSSNPRPPNLGPEPRPTSRSTLRHLSTARASHPVASPGPWIQRSWAQLATDCLQVSGIGNPRSKPLDDSLPSSGLYVHPTLPPPCHTTNDRKLTLVQAGRLLAWRVPSHPGSRSRWRI
jgi:hypothetical protein